MNLGFISFTIMRIFSVLLYRQRVKIKSNSIQGGFRKLDMVIPERFMGLVIGKGSEKLSNIETKTGVALKVSDNNLYIKGSTEQKKKVTREIKAIVVS